MKKHSQTFLFQNFNVQSLRLYIPFRVSLLFGVLLILTACDTTSSIPYKASMQNVISIQQVIDEDNKLSIGSVDYASGYEPNLLCRLLGELDVGNGKSVPQYIKAAFEEELFLAGRLAKNNEDEVNITITRLEFSTVTPAFWRIDLKVSSSSSDWFAITSRNEFKTSFNAYSACRNATAAFGYAVQSALQRVVNHSKFGKLGN